MTYSVPGVIPQGLDDGILRHEGWLRLEMYQKEIDKSLHRRGDLQRHRVFQLSCKRLMIVASLFASLLQSRFVC